MWYLLGVCIQPKCSSPKQTWTNLEVVLSSYFYVSQQIDCWWRHCYHAFIPHQHHVKHTPKPYNPDRLKSGSRRDTNETPTCAVPAHAPQTNALWWGKEGGTTRALLYTSRLVYFYSKAKGRKSKQLAPIQWQVDNNSQQNTWPKLQCHVSEK